MFGSARYLRLLTAFAKFSLLNEMAFRTNYLLKVVVELLWLGLMLFFYRVLFRQTNAVAGWTEAEYFFFIGCYYALDGLMETFFLGNCGAFGELVRNGDLDFVLLKPIDEQFLVSFRTIEWATVPNVVLGAGVMAYGLTAMNWSFDWARVAVFAITFACALAMAYGFLLMLTSMAVYTVRNQSLYELWWLFTSLMRYPKEIYFRSWAAPIGYFFTFVVPVLLIVNVPANSMVRLLDPIAAAGMAVATAVVLLVSRTVFRRALQSYRSASS